MNAYVGRQGIFNINKELVGYELLHRNVMSRKRASIGDKNAATRGVLSDVVNIFGVSALTGGLPAFINFTPKLLIQDFASLIDPSLLVIEVPADVPMDGRLLEKLKHLREDGYRIVLDSYNTAAGEVRRPEMLAMFDYVRAHLGGLSRMKRMELLHYLEGGNAKLIAERLETEQEFRDAAESGAGLFQGFYLQMPSTVTRELAPLSESIFGLLLSELVKDPPDLDRCAGVLRSDMLLRHMFSHRSGEEASMDLRRALDEMGADALLHWVGMAFLKQTNTNPTDALARRAYLRGLFIEQLAADAKGGLTPRRGFLLGLLSLIDRVMGLPLNALLGRFGFEKSIRDALLGISENVDSMFLQYAVIYEMGNERLILPDLGLTLSDFQISQIYMRCISDTDSAFGSPPAPGAGRN